MTKPWFVRSGTVKSTLIAAAVAFLPQTAGAQVYELKFASFLPPQHVMSKWVETWAKDLEQKSAGRLKFTLLFGSQMGPVPRYFDIARSGQADMSWFMHGATPGRFPLSEITHLPFRFCNAEQALRVMNEPELRSKYLDPEHKDVKVLMLLAHPPGQVFVAVKPVRDLGELKGMGIRPPSKSTSELVEALGAKPLGIPVTDLADAMQKKTLDGTLMDYGAGGLAFRLGPHVKTVLEVNAYTTSMGLVMNPASFAKLPADLQQMLQTYFSGRETEAGKLWDSVDQVGKKAMIEAGAQVVVPTAAEREALRKLGAQVVERWISAIDKGGAPGAAAHKLMNELIAKHAGPSGCQS